MEQRRRRGNRRTEIHFVQRKSFQSPEIAQPWIKNEENPRGLSTAGVFVKKPGNTYSRTFGTTIGSRSLTTVFGMGTGVAFQILSPESGAWAGEGLGAWEVMVKKVASGSSS